MDLFLAAVFLMQDKTAEETFKHMEDLVRGAKSVCVRFKVVVTEDAKIQLTGSGALLLKEGNKLNYSITSLEAGIHDKEYHFISDGSQIRGSYHRVDRGAVRELQQATPVDLLGNFIAGVCKAGVGGLLTYDAVTAFLGVSGANPKTVPLRWKEMLTVSGLRQGEADTESANAIHYKLHLSADTSAPAAEMKVWIDPKTNMPVKRIFSFGNFTATETYEEFTLNGDIADEKFMIPKERK